MGLLAIGVALTTALSIVHRRDARKFAFAGFIGVLILAAVPAILWAASRRSAGDLESSDHERAAMKEAARMMAADHPLGIGPNQYVVVANIAGYSERAGVAWGGTTRRAPVHDLYYLVLAEMGVLGLAGLLAMFGSVIALGFRALRRHFPDESGELVPGLLASSIILSIHVSYEFAFMDPNIHYLFAISAGLLVAIWARAKLPSRKSGQAKLNRGELFATG
jgi:O-antigen ligase